MAWWKHIFLLSFVLTVSTARNREGRWFGYKYTLTKVQTDTVTSLIPSSCVHVEASLPACRDVRQLDRFPKFLDQTIYPDYMRGRQIFNPQLQDVINDQDPESMGWGEYFGLVPPTVTITAVKLHTTTLLDPRTVVTFSVKGCKPSRLPMDLERCPIEPTPPINENIVSTTLLAENPVHIGEAYNYLREKKDTKIYSSEDDLPVDPIVSSTEKLDIPDT